MKQTCCGCPVGNVGGNGALGVIEVSQLVLESILRLGMERNSGFNNTYSMEMGTCTYIVLSYILALVHTIH